MSLRPRNWIAGAICLLALTSAPASAQYATPDWTLPSPDGGTVNLYDALARGPVVVSFWATWCIPCLKEMPYLDEMAGRYDGDVTFIAVSVDDTKSMAKVGPLVRAKGWENLVIAQDAAGTLQQQMQVLAPPYTVLFDPNGSVAYRHEGYRAGDEKELEHAIEQVLAARSGPAGPGGFAAPDWELPTPAGGTVRLHDYLERGPVVVSFWATWCIPCLKEMPHLNEMAGELQGEVSFIAISVDDTKSMAKVGPLVRAKGWDDLIIAQDAAGTVQQTLQVLAPPYTILYDQAGSVAYRHEGYRAGDEDELREAIEEVLAAPATRPASGSAPGGLSWRDAVTATDQFEYSFDTETEEEIVENWLDVAYQFGNFRTGVMLNHQSPAEDGNRRNKIMHRYFEYRAGYFDLRVGHFYGMFGRGLLWNSYENRFIRVDTALDGIYAGGRFGNVATQFLSGTTGTTATINDPDGTIAQSIDVRGADIGWEPVRGVAVGAAGLTYLPDLLPESDDVQREWVGTARAGFNHPNASLYLEYGKKTGYDYRIATLEADEGLAFYGNLGLALGPLTASVERSDYDKFRVIKAADGKNTLNKPPALVREHIYSLLARKPHPLNQDDEKGWQLEVNADLGAGWLALGNASRIENHNRETLFEEAYLQLEKDHIGPFRVRGGVDYQDSEGAIRRTACADATWYASESWIWTAQFETQQVDLGVLGRYDQQWMKVELELPPRWTIDAIAETNNKYDAQFEPGEIEGDFFPSGLVSYSLDGGGNLNLWVGKRQAGQLCAGGVCKFEPAFEGVEFYGIFRY